MKSVAIVSFLLLVLSPLHAFDHTHPKWDTVLNEFNNEGLIDYAGLKKNPETLNEYIAGLNEINEENFSLWTPSQKLTFWINAYNAFTLKLIIDHYPIQSSFLASLVYPKNSIRQIDGAWDEITFQALGNRYTLNQIEHDILRKEFEEPRIHFALVCAAMGCPRLRGDAYIPGRLGAQLQNDAERFFEQPFHFRIDREKNIVHLSSIFKWYGADFISQFGTSEHFSGHSDAERAVLNYATTVLPDPDRAYLLNNDFKISYIEYNWTLNDQHDESQN